MNSSAHRTRWTTLAAAATLVAAVAAGAGTPALAAGPAATGPSAATAPPARPDRGALARTIADLPDEGITGALVRAGGRGGQWSGTAGDGVDPDGRFRIGSISKVFTATVVLQLAAERRLALDAPVQRYLPGLLPADRPAVTVGQLLDHTSGLPGGSGLTSGDGSAGWFADHRTDSWTPSEVVTAALAGPMSFAPGSAQQYNGINTFVAGMVVEKVTGRTFAQEVQTRIARPLGLRDTYLPAAGDTSLPGPSAHGYLTVPGPGGAGGPGVRVDVTEQSPWPWAEGGMISSAPDLERFMTALFRGRLLPPAQQAELFTVPDVPNVRNKNCEIGPTAGRACFSMGLMSVTLPDGTVVWGKTGSRPGYTGGLFATRDLSRHVVYSFNPTGLNGEEFPHVWAVVTTAFGSGQAY
ncbi:peptidase [Kitasatospora herbaricolor]|uniref:serine hydrolase domain-containing protein n=1 Tax=Kitasatospora herbaricolor TaxID=68217 RepID=UPI0019A96A54|nr:serine hydrolase domain-containing protein [Kitasatospora herbaricolor]MDQ0309178.1 D-alanyl-D-alanine carboxypeptidase [Kitasatospora herbaricolor]GGV03514.1 peptidase [Kitasatospora herbaricolor]